MATVLHQAAESMRASTVTAREPFAHYQQLRSAVPLRVWWVLRVLTMAGTLGLMAWMVWAPQAALPVFWGLVVPLVPMVLVLAPGLWRQVCPLAMMNQLPRTWRLSRKLTLPDRAQHASFGVAVGLFLLGVGLRVPLLNSHGPALAATLALMMGAALAGGLVFKGRSGWCGTFCLLGPVQRVYGHAPLAVVPNGYCPSCVGCQQHCYDFRPESAVFDDLDAQDPRHAQWRQWFFGLLPGLILGFFLHSYNPDDGLWHYEGVLIGSALASLGLYAVLSTALTLSPYRLSLLFGLNALALFYLFTGPSIVIQVGHLMGVTPAPSWLAAGASMGLLAGLSMLFKGLRNEQLHRRALRQRRKDEVERKAQHAQQAQQWHTVQFQPVTLTNRANGQRSAITPGQRLAEALREQGTALPKGCGAGVCGGDAVAICEGMEHLPPAGAQELATLRRMGLEGRARLACMCEVTAPVTVDTRREALNTAPAAPAKDTPDPLVNQGIQRIVIIGNGIAGVSVAEALRRQSPGVELTVLSEEAHPFYNRMGLAEVLQDPTQASALYLRDDRWAQTWRITQHLQAGVKRIDRHRQKLQLRDGRRLAYDRLVLATGADAARPGPVFDAAPNAFVLRTLRDAERIHQHVLAQGVRQAVVVGGGVLGIEAALALRQWGLGVQLLERAPHLMAAQLDTGGGHRLAEALRERGIAVLTDVASMEWLHGDDHALSGVQLPDGHTLNAELFLACLGIRPRLFLAEQIGLDTQARGVVVDTWQRTSDPHVLAVGDVALTAGPAGLWSTATAQAERAVQGLIAETELDDAPAPTLKLKADDLDVVAWGRCQSVDGDEVWQADAECPFHWRVLWQGDRLVGWQCVGAAGSAARLEQALAGGCPRQARQRLDAI